ncbi:MAG TPA: ABC transporter ATP-binding protein [Acidimicrobiales bacterium]|nr:ABC transporter ATP-binding protein [Acidimicrobiales bacterium]
MIDDTCVLEAVDLGKRYGRTWGLQDCTLAIPKGRVAALVGPNGSGKSTLLRMAAGLSRPNVGSLRVLGHSPSQDTGKVLERIGYLDQERPLYKSFRVAEMLRFGEKTNPSWNMQVAKAHLAQLDIPLSSRVTNLSGGQQAQVALTLCLSKQPELLLLDEPAAALDPVAREDLLRLLMRQVADSESSVLLSTHALRDVAAICDYVIILSHSRVVLSNDTEYLLASHRFLSAVHEGDLTPPSGVTVIGEQRSARGQSLLVRVELPINDARWRVDRPTLDEIVLAYLREGSPGANRRSVITTEGGVE